MLAPMGGPHLSGSAGGVWSHDQAPAAPLGILTKSCKASTPSEVNTDADSALKRVRKWARQSAAKTIVGGRLNTCCRNLIPQRENVDVWKSGNQTFSYGGLMVCGSVWTCPVCASKITEKRRSELAQALEAVKENGGSALLLTLTVPHYAHHRVETVLGGLTDAYRRMTNRAGFGRFTSAVGCFGRVRTLEVTYGPNGWHPHFHVLLFTDKPTSKRSLAAWSADLLKQWQSACVKSGLPMPNSHGLSLDDGSRAAAYASKWGMDHEMTKGHLKTGKTNDHLSPFALLDLHLDRQSADSDFQRSIAPQAGALFFMYAQAFKGRRQLVWSAGLRDLLDLAPEKSDEELAETHDQDATLFAKIPLDTWRQVLRHDKRGELLEICRQGLSALEKWLEDLKLLGGLQARPFAPKDTGSAATVGPLTLGQGRRDTTGCAVTPRCGQTDSAHKRDFQNPDG